MKLLHITLLAAAAASFVMAEDDHFVTSMKSINAQVGALRKMEKKTGPEAAASAEKIAGAYEHMIAFWQQRTLALQERQQAIKTKRHSSVPA